MTVQERRRAIKQYIVSQNGNPVGKKDICTAIGYPKVGDFAADMKAIMEQSDSIIASGAGKLRAYSFNPKKSLYSEMKNPEGYKDSTAGKAIANVMRNDPVTLNESDGTYPGPYHFGDFWKVSNRSTSGSSQEGMIVLAAKNGSIICVPVWPSKLRFMEEKETISWIGEDGNYHYVYVMNIQSRPAEEFKERKWSMPKSEKEKLSKKVAGILGIKPDVVEKVVTKEIPVEKIVEKVVTKEVPVEKIVEKEVPVEVIKEVPIDPRDIELATLRVRVEIYEQFLRGEFKGLAS